MVFRYTELVVTGMTNVGIGCQVRYFQKLYRCVRFLYILYDVNGLCDYKLRVIATKFCIFRLNAQNELHIYGKLINFIMFEI